MGDQAEKLKSDIAELEEKVFGVKADSTESKPEDTSSEGGEQEVVIASNEPSPDGTAPDPTDTFAATEENVDHQGVQQKSQKKRVSWKKRFIKLKQHHDTAKTEDNRKIAYLLAEKASLEKEVIRLNKVVSDLQRSQSSSSVKDLVTPEELNIIGEEGVSSIDKITTAAINRATAPLIEEINRLKNEGIKKTEEEAENRMQSDYDKFLDSLADLVPEYAQLDTDDGFNKWLAETIDPYSHRSYLTLLKNAEDSRDVGRVAFFFKEYKKLINPNEQVIAQSVTPVGTSSSPMEVQNGSEKKEPVVTLGDYNTFVSDVTKGKYRGRQKEKLAKQAMFDKAFRNGGLS